MFSDVRPRVTSNRMCVHFVELERRNLLITFELIVMVSALPRENWMTKTPTDMHLTVGVTTF
jgi:hypothetical protein